MLTLTQLVKSLEKGLTRLPGPIRRPVEREWTPIRELFLQHRPPRLLIVGEPGAETELWVRAIFQMAPEAFEAGKGPWRMYRHLGVLSFAIAENEAAVREAMLEAVPDVFVYRGEVEPAELARLRGEIPGVFAGGVSREAVLEAIARLLPLEARLEFAQASGDPSAQREIATFITRSATAICTAIGAQPIPLADFPILTSLQLLMVSGIIQATGREWNLRLARDFLAALGANVGVGLLLREGARAAVKLLPGWGNAISGAVAGAGTYAIGRAASAFFIEGASIGEARKRFRWFRKNRPPELPD